MQARIRTEVRTGSIKFFRLRIQELSPEGVGKLFDQFEEDVATIKKNCLRLAWYMRGSVSYEDVLNMSDNERKWINELIESNLETTKKTQLPFF